MCKIAKFDKVARESDMLLAIKKSSLSYIVELMPSILKKTNSGEIPTIFYYSLSIQVGGFEAIRAFQNLQ